MRHGERGTYTFVAKNEIGTAFEKTLVVDAGDVENVINLTIDETSERELVTEVGVSIDYSKIYQSTSRTNQYKIGKSSWTNYTSDFKIDSYTVLEKGWQEDDNKTVIVYGRSIDKANNLVTINKKTIKLDLDMPDKPVITQTTFESYASITEYGVGTRGEVSIDYGTRTDIDKLYSLDNGQTWKTYTGTFQCDAIYILARSVKKVSGLYKQSDIKQLMVTASDSVGTSAYDGNNSTQQPFNSGSKKIYISNGAQGKKLNIIFSLGARNYDTCYLYIEFYNSSETKINTYTYSFYGKNTYMWNYKTYTNEIFNIPNDARYIKFSTTYCYDSYYGIGNVVNLIEINIKT